MSLSAEQYQPSRKLAEQTTESHVLVEKTFPYRRILSLYSNDSWENSVWHIQNRISLKQANLHFPNLQPTEITLLKVSIINFLSRGNSISTCRRMLHDSSVIFNFFHSKGFTFPDIRQFWIQQLIEYLESQPYSIAQKNNCMVAMNHIIDSAISIQLFETPIALDCTYRWKTPVNRKKAPDHIVVEQLDRIFFNLQVDIPLHFRCIYMILRLRSNRISEVLSMSLDCIKYPELGVFSIVIPTTKETSFHVPSFCEYSFLMDGQCEALFFKVLIQQQELAQAIQDSLEEIEKDYLFVSPNGHIVTAAGFNECLKSICTQHHIVDARGCHTAITSHDLRHTDICERLSSNIISPEMTMRESNHHSMSQTMGYGYSSIHDETEHLSTITSTVFQPDPPTVAHRRHVSSAKYDRIASLPDSRIIPGYGVCMNGTCIPRFEKCFSCSSFTPDPIYKDYMEQAIQLLQLKNAKLVRQKNHEKAVEKNENQIRIFQLFLKKIR